MDAEVSRLINRLNALEAIVLGARQPSSAAAASSSGLTTALTSAHLFVGNATNVATDTAVTGDVTISNAGVTAIGAAKVTEAMQLLANNTTNDVSTSKHGYAPIGDGNVSKFLNANGAYTAPSASSGGAVSLISEVVTTGSQGNVTFSVPSGFRQMQMIALARGTTAAVSTGLRMQFNADTGNNYDTDRENRFGSAQGIGGASFELAEISAATATANYASAVSCIIPNYIGTVFYKSLYSTSSMETSQAAGGVLQQICVGWWRNTAAVTSMLIFPTAGNLTDGSVFSLYGWS